eukprot:666110-Hanusia_phi.AAC.2
MISALTAARAVIGHGATVIRCAEPDGAPPCTRPGGTSRTGYRTARYAVTADSRLSPGQAFAAAVCGAAGPGAKLASPPGRAAATRGLATPGRLPASH